MAIPTKIDSFNLQESLMFICIEKNQFQPCLISSDFAKILPTYFGYFGYAWLCLFCFIQKIKFIHHLFLELLLRYWKLVALDTLRMPDHVHQNLTCKKAWCLFGCKKLASLFLLSRDITKILQPFFFVFLFFCLLLLLLLLMEVVLCACLAIATKNNGITLWRLWY